MQVVTSIRNRQFVESFSEVNERLKSRALTNKKTSDKYATVDSELVLRRVLELAMARGLHVDRTRVHTRGKGTLHTVRIRFTALSGSGNDTGHPELTIINSYNGESSLQFHLGFYRLICSNGLTVPVTGFEGINYSSGRRKHIVGPMMSDFTRHLDERICAALDALTRIGSKFEQLQSVSVTKEQESAVIDQISLTKGQRKQYDAIRDGLYNRDTEGNLWAVYNAVNEAIRRSQRSEFATEMRNVNLLATIQEAYDHANVA